MHGPPGTRSASDTRPDPSEAVEIQFLTSRKLLGEQPHFDRPARASSEERPRKAGES